METSSRVRAGWRTPLVILASGSVLLAISLGMRHTFGLFLAPMSREHGWTREVFAFAIALQNLVWGAAQPFAGRLADRLGAGRVILGGSALYVAGLVLMAWSQSGTALAVSAGLVVGLGLSGTTMPVVFGAVVRSTPPERRSMAMGVAMAVGSLGQFAMLPGALNAIEAFGSATTLLAFAAIGLLMAPLAIALTERPAASTSRAAPRSLRDVLGEALGHRGFWLLCFGFFAAASGLLYKAV